MMIADVIIEHKEDFSVSIIDGFTLFVIHFIYDEIVANMIKYFNYLISFKVLITQINRQLIDCTFFPSFFFFFSCSNRI